MLTLRTSVGLTYLFLCMFVPNVAILTEKKKRFLDLYCIVVVFDGLMNIFKSDYLGIVISDACRARTERPEDWVPVEAPPSKQKSDAYVEYSETLQVSEDETRNIVDIFSIHSSDGTGKFAMS